MTLIKTSILNAIAVSVRMLTLLGINKILALYVGPAGYAAIGQFQNAVQMITTLGSGAIGVGVTKYTAEYYENEEKQHVLWRTAGSISFFGSVLTGLIVSVFSKKLAIIFLNDSKYESVFVWLGIALTFFVFNALLIAILNGKKEISKYVVVNIAGSLFSLIVSVLMITSMGLYGALLALSINQSLVFFVTLIVMRQATWFKLEYLIGKIDKTIAVNLTKYTAMALTSAIVIPLSHIFVRNYIGNEFGWKSAGYWEAMWRLSSVYLMFVTSVLSVYYLPKLSELRVPSEIRAEIILGYKIILPMAIFCGCAIYFLRDFIIKILFTEEFLPMRDLFAIQLAGDTLKIGAWILSYLMIGKALVKYFIATEVIFGIGFYGLTWLLAGYFGLKAVVIAHALNYLIYWIVMYFLLNSYLSNKE